MPRPPHPAIPQRCAHRPVHTGLVVPWVTLQPPGSRLVFGALDERRRDYAMRNHRCQVCGEPLRERACLVVRPRDVQQGYTSEPALDPECLAYSARACPMLNGQMDRYRSSSAIAALPPGTVATANAGDRKGKAAEAFETWWINPREYRLKTRPDGRLLGIDLDLPVLKRRPLRAATPTREETVLAALRALLDLTDTNTPEGE